MAVIVHFRVEAGGDIGSIKQPQKYDDCEVMQGGALKVEKKGGSTLILAPWTWDHVELIAGEPGNLPDQGMGPSILDSAARNPF